MGSRFLRVFRVVSYVSLLLLQCNAWCQFVVPRQIRISGELQQRSPDFYSRPVRVQFTIFETLESNVALWNEEHNLQVGMDRRFDVVLGGNDGLPNELFTQQNSLWLEIRVEGEVDSPRTKLISVPYALKAADAEKLVGKPAS